MTAEDLAAHPEPVEGRADAPGPGVGFPRPCLMLVTDRSLCGGSGLVTAVAEAVAGGVNAVQLREKDLPPADLLALAARLREATADLALLLVNGPLEVALECGADGVHLPEDAPMIERPARPFLVGRSVHSAMGAAAAWAEGTDYLTAGPAFETRSHPGLPPAGPDLIHDVANAVGIPVVAIGGITASRVDDVVLAGASGIAVISPVLAAGSPREAAATLRKALDLAVAGLEYTSR